MLRKARMMNIDDLPISNRLHNVLFNEQIKSLEELTELTERECMRWPNFGKRSLDELKFIMAEHGLSLNSTTRSDRITISRDVEIARKISIAIQALREIQVLLK
jgi:DNA-directed RNA polymerase alpha subunit